MTPAHTFEITQHALSVNSFTQYMKMQSYPPWHVLNFQAFKSVEYVKMGLWLMTNESSLGLEIHIRIL